MKGVKIFDLKDSIINPEQLVMANGPCSRLMTIWVNNLMMLSDKRFIVADKEKNFYIMERNDGPKCESDAIKIKTLA